MGHAFTSSDPRQVWVLERSTGAPIHIPRGDPDGLKARARAQLRCPFPDCLGEITIAGGPKIRHHFRHLSDASHPYSPMTIHHLEGQLAIARWFSDNAPGGTLIDLEKTVPGTKRRADVLVQVPGQRPLAIEVEYEKSGNTDDGPLRKHQEYAEAGIDDLWLVGHTRLRIHGNGTWVGLPGFASKVRRAGAQVAVINPSTAEIGTLLASNGPERIWDGSTSLARLVVEPLAACRYSHTLKLRTPAAARLEPEASDSAGEQDALF